VDKDTPLCDRDIADKRTCENCNHFVDVDPNEKDPLGCSYCSRYMKEVYPNQKCCEDINKHYSE
jgi:hypothetical protein